MISSFDENESNNKSPQKRSPWGEKTMGTRKNPTDIGRVPNYIKNRQSNDSSIDRNRWNLIYVWLSAL